MHLSNQYILNVYSYLAGYYLCPLRYVYEGDFPREKFKNSRYTGAILCNLMNELSITLQ